MKNDRVNWQAMQLVKTKIGSGQQAALVHQRPSDTNVKHMSMGSWHANARDGGRRRFFNRGGGK